MKKIILILLFFSFILNEKGFAQSIDMGNYYLIAQSPLSVKQQAEIESIARNFNIALQTDLTVKGHTTLNDTNLRRHTTELYGHQVSFNAAAGQVVFMRVLFLSLTPNCHKKLTMSQLYFRLSHYKLEPVNIFFHSIFR